MLSQVKNILQKTLLFCILMQPQSIENYQKPVSRRKARKFSPDHLQQSLFQLFEGSLWRNKILFMRHSKKVCAIMAHRENFNAPFQKTMRHGARQNYPCKTDIAATHSHGIGASVVRD